MEVPPDETNQMSTTNAEAKQDQGTATDMDTPVSTRHPLETIEEETTATAGDQAQENDVEKFKTKEGVFMACSK